MAIRKFKGEGKVQFLAKKEEIKSYMEKGWPVSAILDQLKTEGAITLGYHQFRHYVRTLITGGPPAEKDREAQGNKETPGRKKPRIGKVQDESFTYNPNADISDFLGHDASKKPER